MIFSRVNNGQGWYQSLPQALGTILVPIIPLSLLFIKIALATFYLLISIHKLPQSQNLQTNHLTGLFHSLKNIGLYMLIWVYNQFIIAMEEEEFDEFEEATYSQPPPAPEAPSPPSPLSTHAALALNLPPDHDSNHPILPPSSLPAVQLTTEPLENGSSLGEESIWPQLGKSSSAHVVPIEPFMIDFSKSYSLSEQMSVPITENFFGAANKEQPELANLQLTPPIHDIISPLPPTTALPVANNNLLFEFSAPQDGLDVFGFDSVVVTTPSMETNQAETLPKIEESVVGTDVYAPGGVNVGNQFDIFTPLTQSTGKIGSQQQVKIDKKEEAGLLGGIGDFQYIAQPVLQFEHPYIEVTPTLTPTIPQADPVVQVSQVKAEPQDLNWMQAYSAPTITTTNNQPNIDQDQPTITEEAADGDRKESEEFQFHEAKPAEPEREPEDVRKESEQFVFETTIQPLATKQDMPYTQIQDFGQEWSSQPNHQILPPEQPPISIQPSEEEVFQQPKEEEPAQQAPAPEQDEDQFGDFEETTQAQDHQAQPEVVGNGVIEQDNTVEIKEQYMNSPEADFYRSRQKELQEFVNSLPDYSFLFAQGFL